MRDDQRRDHDKPEERFEDALDDLFGDVSAEDAAPAEPPSNSVPERSQPVQMHPAPIAEPSGSLIGDHPPAAQSAPLTVPPAGGRSWRRIGCIALSAVLGAILLCLVILMIIGFIVGDQTTPTPGV